MIKTIVQYVNFYYPTIKNLNYSEDIKTALVFRYLYEHYVKDYITLETIIYYLTGDCSTRRPPTKSRILRNHLIFHNAFKTFRRLYKTGRGCVYLFDCPIKSEVIGYLSGIIYWIFYKGLK